MIQTGVKTVEIKLTEDVVQLIHTLELQKESLEGLVNMSDDELSNYFSGTQDTM